MITSATREHDPGYAAYFLSMRETTGACSLVAPSGMVVFRAAGEGARRRCLEIARDFAVLVLRP